MIPAPPAGRAHRGAGDLGVAGAVALAGECAEELLLGAARDVHGVWARRVFWIADRATGGSLRTTQAVHDGITRAMYAGLGVGLKATVRGLHAAERRGLGPRLHHRPGGRAVVSAVHGLVGDRLVEQRPEYALEMAVREGGRDVPLQPEALAAAFPAATPHLVVFLHGLGENDESWDRRREERGGSYGTRLADETSWTPVFLRANTGLPVAENGVALASLLDRLVRAWPTDVERVALVGHSMGGLVIRSACAVRTDATDPWTARVTNVVTLGTPHLGAPLERVVHAGAKVLGVLPESAPFGRILDYRSVGILDLRRGLAADVQHLPHARYHLVAATLGSSHRDPVSEALGDLFVRYPSAVGRPRLGREMFPGADVLHVPGAGHFSLLNHPDVYAALRCLLG